MKTAHEYRGCLMGHLVSTAFAATLLTCGSAALWLPAAAEGHYLFAWAGDPSGNGEDFIAVIDGDPASSNYGQLEATGASGIKSQQMHHTEYWMPESSLLFANDHAAGRTVVMDLRDPLHPGTTRVITCSFQRPKRSPSRTIRRTTDGLHGEH